MPNFLIPQDRPTAQGQLCGSIAKDQDQYFKDHQDQEITQTAYVSIQNCPLYTCNQKCFVLRSDQEPK